MGGKVYTAQEVAGIYAQTTSDGSPQQLIISLGQMTSEEAHGGRNGRTPAALVNLAHRMRRGQPESQPEWPEISRLWSKEYDETLRARPVTKQDLQRLDAIIDKNPDAIAAHFKAAGLMPLLDRLGGMKGFREDYWHRHMGTGAQKGQWYSVYVSKRVHELEKAVAKERPDWPWQMRFINKFFGRIRFFEAGSPQSLDGLVEGYIAGNPPGSADGQLEYDRKLVQCASGIISQAISWAAAHTAQGFEKAYQEQLAGLSEMERRAVDMHFRKGIRLQEIGKGAGFKKPDASRGYGFYRVDTALKKLRELPENGQALKEQLAEAAYGALELKASLENGNAPIEATGFAAFAHVLINQAELADYQPAQAQTQTQAGLEAAANPVWKVF